MPLSNPRPSCAAVRLVTADVVSAARQLGASAGGPGTARLLAVLVDPLAERDEVLSALHGEPGLAARMLRVANAPYYGQSGRVGTLDRAVQLLGLDAVRGICAACCMDRTLHGRGPGTHDPHQFRRHSLAAATAGRELARALAPDLQAEAFMGGLLHDIGLLLLTRLRPHQMAHLLGPSAPEDGEAVLAMEREQLGLSHDEAAAHLAAAWGLPTWLIDAVGGHHQRTSQAPVADGMPPSLPRLVQAADALAHHAGFGLAASCAQTLPWPALDVGADEVLVARLVTSLPVEVDALLSGAAA